MKNTKNMGVEKLGYVIFILLIFVLLSPLLPLFVRAYENGKKEREEMKDIFKDIEH